MKKKKYLALLLFMLLCVFSLTACVATEEAVEDASITENMISSAQTLSKQIVEMDDATLAQYIEYYGVDGASPDPGLLSGLTSWENSRDDLGAYGEFGDCKVVYNASNKNYVATAEITFEKRNCEFKLIVDRHLKEIQSITFNPVFSTGEKMAKAGMNTLMGIGTVFLMLIFISLVIYCFRFINKFEAARNSKKAPAKEAAPVLTAPVVTEEEQEEEADDLELAAVITAAIAAYEADMAGTDISAMSTDGLIVRSIRRVGASNWKRA